MWTLPTKAKGNKKEIVIKPMVFTEFQSRCQVDQNDFQSHTEVISVYNDLPGQNLSS